MTNARIIRNWIKQFSDQKLAEVYAFNQDRKMSFINAHACILGVTYADRLHTKCDDYAHTQRVMLAELTPEGRRVEWAYLHLGWCFLRNWRMSRILLAEIRQRDRERAKIRIAREAEEPVIQRQEEGVTCSQLQD